MSPQRGSSVDDNNKTTHSLGCPKGVVFRANYRQTPEGKEELKELTLRGPGSGKGTSMKGCVAIQGLYWSGLAAWLPEVLNRDFPDSKFAFEDIEEVGGEPCARLSNINSAGSGYKLWLDLNHDCLLRRSLYYTGSSGGQDYVVDEFQRLKNGIWFPKRGRFQLNYGESQNQLWVITEVAVNEALDLSRFEPPQPVVGTIVDDGKGKVWRHGAAASQSGASPAVAGGVMPQQSTSFSATPPTSRWLWWSSGLLMASVVFLVAGFFFWRKK